MNRGPMNRGPMNRGAVNVSRQAPNSEEIS